MQCIRYFVAAVILLESTEPIEPSKENSFSNNSSRYWSNAVLKQKLNNVFTNVEKRVKARWHIRQNKDSAHKKEHAGLQSTFPNSTDHVFCPYGRKIQQRASRVQRRNWWRTDYVSVSVMIDCQCQITLCWALNLTLCANKFILTIHCVSKNIPDIFDGQAWYVLKWILKKTSINSIYLNLSSVGPNSWSVTRFDCHAAACLPDEV